MANPCCGSLYLDLFAMLYRWAVKHRSKLHGNNEANGTFVG